LMASGWMRGQWEKGDKTRLAIILQPQAAIITLRSGTRVAPFYEWKPMLPDMLKRPLSLLGRYLVWYLAPVPEDCGSLAVELPLALVVGHLLLALTACILLSKTASPGTWE